MTLSPTRYLDQLRADAAALAGVDTGSLDRPVPSCPGWTVDDLLGHCAGVARFATHHLRQAPGADLDLEGATGPFPDGATGIDLWAEHGPALVAALEATDPDEHRPNWFGAPTSTWYFRRMAQEFAVHRWDLDAAFDRAAAIPADIAVDGVDELAEVFFANAADRGVVGTGETVHLHATDDDLAGGEWMFRFHDAGVTVTHEHGKGDMAVRGPASDLLLFAWNRRPIEVTTFGEPDPLAWWPERVAI